MLYAFVADLHGNLEATIKVFKKIDKIGPDLTIVIGDLINYCANPNEVVEEVASRQRILVLEGNHDVACLYDDDRLAKFKPLAYEAGLWTRDQLIKSDATREFLQNLPRQICLYGEEPGIVAVHGAPPSDLETYLYYPYQAQPLLQHLDEDVDVWVIAHTHEAAFFEFGGPNRYLTGKALRQYVPYTTIPLTKGCKTFINGGSVGQPRDGDPSAAFCTFNTETLMVKYYRVQYKYSITGDKIVTAGLNHDLAARLADGR